MTNEDDLAAAVEATLAKLGADNESDAQLRRRKRVLHRLYHEGGMSAPAIARALTERLAERGYSEAQIKGLGVSLVNVRKAVESPPPPED